MQPRSLVSLDSRAFSAVRETIKRTKLATPRGDRPPQPCPSLPPEVSFQLTFRCNLRCKDCFQWGDNGFFRTFPPREQQRELDLGVIERVLAETREARSRVNLWGGEPLLYRQWEALAGLLEADPRPIVLCTNGLLLDRRIQSILRLSPNLLTVISLDGFCPGHEANRGNDTFARTIENLKLLLTLRKQGSYRGDITLNCVLNEQNIPTLYEFMEHCESLGVDRVIFSFPWYIPPAVAESMDAYWHENFSWLAPVLPGRRPSWHYFTYRLVPEMLRDLRRELERLNSRVWKVRVRLHPALEPHELTSAVLGQRRSLPRPPTCLALFYRLAIGADGLVSACPTFREFCVGDIRGQGVKEVWQGERFARVRQVMRRRPLPHTVCAKCYLLSGNAL